MHSYKEKLSLVEHAMCSQVRKNDHNQVQIEEHWVQVTTPEAPVPHLNGVVKCILTNVVAEERISKTIQHYKNLNLPLRFKISPSSRPENLSSILLSHDMKQTETLFGLYADPKNLNIPKNPNVEIQPLKLDSLEDWLIVQTSAWGVPSQGIEYLRKQVGQTLRSDTKKGMDFIAYYNQIPVASSGVQIFENYGYLAGAAVNPEMRKIGIYRALLFHRLEILKNLNLPAIIHCLETTSAPICLRLGFEKICEIYNYEIFVNKNAPPLR